MKEEERSELKALIICIVGTFLVLCFARPTQLARMINPNNRMSVEQVQGYCRILIGQVPAGVPVIVFGSARSPESAVLYAELQKRGIRFNAIEVLDNPQAAPVMNQIGHQNIPTTLVGTYIVDGVDADGIKATLTSEQQSMKWPLSSGGSGNSASAGAHSSSSRSGRGGSSRHSSKGAQHHTNHSQSHHQNSGH